MRLTAELINDSLSYINPLKERELDLRGNKIPSIENLAAALHNDALDLTDNALSSLSNFPLFPRIISLYCARNRINHIAPTLSRSLPKLQTLVLTENRFSNLSELVPLRACKKLIYLSLLENPITAKENYRLWVIFLLPSVRHLDFVRVRDAERVAARELFGKEFSTPTDAARKILAIAPTSGRPLDTDDGDDGAPPAKRTKTRMTDDERGRVEEMIRSATSLAEIERMERALAEGRMPG